MLQFYKQTAAAKNQEAVVFGIQTLPLVTKPLSAQKHTEEATNYLLVCGIEIMINKVCFPSSLHV